MGVDFAVIRLCSETSEGEEALFRVMNVFVILPQRRCSYAWQWPSKKHTKVRQACPWGLQDETTAFGVKMFWWTYAATWIVKSSLRRLSSSQPLHACPMGNWKQTCTHRLGPRSGTYRTPVLSHPHAVSGVLHASPQFQYRLILKLYTDEWLTVLGPKDKRKYKTIIYSCMLIKQKFQMLCPRDPPPACTHRTLWCMHFSMLRLWSAWCVGTLM